MSNTLHLTLKKEWFDMIANGIKTEEYREIKPYWTKRLVNSEDERNEGKGYYKKYDKIEFKNGYGANVPTMEVELLLISEGSPYGAWIGEYIPRVYRLHLGKILSETNV